MRRVVVWFRRDLTLRDNTAFTRATNSDEVACAWVFEPKLWASAGPFRQARLIEALSELDRELAQRGGRLTILSGPATEAIPRIAHRVGASEVYWNADVSRFAQTRDQAVRRALADARIGSTISWGTLVQPPGSILTAAGTVPRVFKRFHDVWTAMPVAPEAIGGGATVLTGMSEDSPLDLGAAPMDKGANSADQHLERFLTIVDDYERSRDRPDLDATSSLSAALHFGSISPRHVLRHVGSATASRRAFVRQLAWRDWFAHLLFERPDLQVLSQQAHFDRVTWKNDPEEIDAWRRGQTGFPIVDAAMRELATTGRLHGRLRMIAASFLVKDLLVDWRIGERYFRRVLSDGDVSQNVGNWQWVAGTGPDSAPYFRILNPTVQAQRFDPSGDYVRRWLPELASLPGGSIHLPENAASRDLDAGGIVLGTTYPRPIVDHATRRVETLLAYAAARHTTATTPTKS